MTHHERIAVTTPARTIADLRRAGNRADLARATRQAAYLGLELGSEGGRALGAGKRWHDRGELERRFLRLCHQHRLPLPHVTFPIGPF